jgi:DNA gyrase subunit A
VGAVQVEESDEVMLITNGGTLVRTPVKDVSVMSRNTQGVTMIRLTKKEKLIGIEKIENLDSDEDDDEAYQEGEEQQEIGSEEDE